MSRELSLTLCRLLGVRLVPAAQPEPDPLDLDEVTLARAQRGDRAAFRVLVERFERPVFALLGRILLSGGHGSLVEDLAQETFVRVYNGLPRFGQDGRHRLSAWIFTIAARLALDELRRRPRRAEWLSDQVLERVASPADDRADRLLERRGLGTAIQRAVEALPPEYRAAFLLREVHGLEYEAIAEALDIDLGTVKSRLWRARTALRAALSGIYDEG
jgi:RNA polymerase sigma-70 factor (ECF subfamily)